MLPLLRSAGLGTDSQQGDGDLSPTAIGSEFYQQETDWPPEPPEGVQPADTLTLAQGDCVRLLTSRSVRSFVR